MLKPTRTILALAAGSLVLGLVGAGVAVAADGPMATMPSHETVAGRSDRSVIGKVVSRGPLKIRSKPTTRSESLGEVYPNRTVEIECKSRGESVDGNRIWYRLQEKWNEWENGNEENGTDENDTDENDTDENGTDENDTDENGTGENGTGGNGDWQNRPNRPSTQSPQSRKYAEERWVAARYVQNQSSVRYCR